MTTVPAPVMHLGEVVRPEPDIVLEEAEVLAVANMTYLAERHRLDGHPKPGPGPNYQRDYRQFCQRCNLRRHRGDCL